MAQRYIFACFILFITIAIHAQPGAPETAFNGTGYTRVSVPGKVNTSFEAGIAQPDGKVIVAGHASEFANNPYNTDAVVVRYNPDGTPDVTFGNSGIVVTDIEQLNNAFYAVALQADGRIVAAGRAQTLGDSRSDCVVARYNPDGSPDLSFGANGIRRIAFGFNDDEIVAIAVQADGKIVIAGTFYGVGADMLVARLNPDGSLDAGFGNQGKTLVDFMGGTDLGTSVIIQPDGKILASSYTYGPAGSDMGVARLNVDGSLDNSFGNDGKVTADIYGSIDDAAQSVAISGGRIIIAGWAILPGNASGKYYMAFAAFNADGSPDVSFGDNGIDTTDFGISHDFFEGVIVRGDQVIGAGPSSQDAEQNSNENFDFAVAAYQLNGDNDHTFGINGKVNTDFSGTSGLISGDQARGLFYHNNTLYVVGSAAHFTGEWDFTSYGIIAAYQLKPLPDCYVSGISNVTATPSVIWPPNHTMKEVTLNYMLTGNCPDVTVTVTSNEPEGSEPDWQIIDDHHVLLRAERNGDGNGRIYTITISGTDAAGNPVSASVNVPVPKSAGEASSLETSNLSASAKKSFAITLASNPTRNHFTLNIDRPMQERVDITVYDVAGKIIERRQANANSNNIQFGYTYRPGIYFVEAKQNGQRRMLKAVKLK